MDYRKALEHAIIYIESHLGEEIKVEEVARAAGYSYYHLNRQFVALLGESVGGYIKKRRLASGARELLYSERRIIDIGMECGFESAEAFSRAFKAAYQVSPQTYRKNRLHTFISGKERLDKELLDHLTKKMTVHPKIVTLPPILVAGVRGETTLQDNKLPALWRHAGTLVGQIPNRIPGERTFGICEACQENSLFLMSSDVLFTEVVGVEVSSFVGLPEGFVEKRLPGGRYAVFTHRGSLRTLTQTFDYIWGTWFLQTREEVDCREDFEWYDSRFLGYDHPDSELDIYIPVL